MEKELIENMRTEIEQAMFSIKQDDFRIGKITDELKAINGLSMD